MPLVLLDPLKNGGEWHRHLAELPTLLNDVYFYPEYLELNRSESAAPRAFIYNEGASRWLYPFLLRSIPHLQGAGSAASRCFDIEAPYGYGGPLCNSGDPAFIGRANEAFSRWCLTQGVVAEFVRFHPLLENDRLMPSVETFRDRETVSLDLGSLTEAANPFDAKTNSMLRRSERSGLSCEVTVDSGDFGEFVRLYRETMARLNAHSFYYFSGRYFDELLSLIKEHGFVVVARMDDAVIAAAAFLRGASFLHYHLSATDRANKVPGVMNSVLHTAALHGKSARLLALHLGGGRTRSQDDSLLKFKRTMATGCHQFLIGKRIHNAERYGELRAAWERKYPHLVDIYGGQLLCYHNGL